MTGARRRALLILCVLALVGGALAFAASRREPPRSRLPAQRPTLMLLTSLPLLFGEEFSLKGGGSPALEKLETRYRVVPISVSSAPELSKGRLLLMAQPLAQTPENLVALDDWVRAGGRVLLLADPMLEWPSKRPLGDPLRPPPMFMDTGLLAHWGLRLDAPDKRGAQPAELGGYDVLTVSPGQLYGGCRIGSGRVVAHCRIGKG
ncbi:MAG: hypothetical protein QOF05_1486, partial [Sphingomonadales bacterium]|nr:hypothetical protein [Sphingomonadales bacterium]